MKIIAVPAFQETLRSGTCGPASLKMVLAYYGVEKEEAELVRMCRTDPRVGTDDDGIRRAAEALGFVVKIKNESSIADVEKYLRRGIPLLVNWFSRGRPDYGLSEVADGHYSVVVGLDKEHIYLQDPEIGRLRTLGIPDFLRVWFDFKGEQVESWSDMIVRQLIAVYPREELTQADDDIVDWPRQKQALAIAKASDAARSCTGRRGREGGITTR
jgi:predicted double-glycine peptidase